MKKYFWMGFFTGFFFLWIVVSVWHLEKDTSLETTLTDEKEIFSIKGSERLSDEEKQRIEGITGKFQVGEMKLYSSGFNFELYKDESYVDALVGQEIEFKDIDDIIFEGEHYKIISIDTHDAEYYFGERYRNSWYYFGEKSTVEIWYHSLDDGRNAFGIIIAANGRIFFQPGSVVGYGDGIYTTWGIYEVFPYIEKEDYYD